VRTFVPAPPLKTRVLSITVAENAGGENLVLPSTSAVLGLQFRGRVQAGDKVLSLAGVTGIQATARRYTYAADTGSVLVRFTPQGAACLGVPALELSDSHVALEELLPAARVVEATERLQAARDDRARVEVVEELLLELPFARDPLVTQGIELLANAGEGASVARVARSLGVSERQFERRFKARVGLTPKHFARLQRFERAVNLARSAPSLSVAAQDAGYYDQSHFIRDFRGFVGVTPGAALPIVP